MENNGLYFGQSEEKKKIDFVIVSDLPNTPEYADHHKKR